MRGVPVLLALVVSSLGVAVPGAMAAKAPRTVTVRVGTSDFGPILQDRKRLALYRFTADAKGPSRCYGECARVWPPLLLPKGAKLKASNGAASTKLGSVARKGGKRQVTYGGQPLYYWVGDTEPGAVGCQAIDEFGGLWYILRGDGSTITRRTP